MRSHHFATPGPWHNANTFTRAKRKQVPLIVQGRPPPATPRACRRSTYLGQVLLPGLLLLQGLRLAAITADHLDGLPVYNVRLEGGGLTEGAGGGMAHSKAAGGAGSSPQCSALEVACHGEATPWSLSGVDRRIGPLTRFEFLLFMINSNSTDDEVVRQSSSGSSPACKRPARHVHSVPMKPGPRVASDRSDNHATVVVLRLSPSPPACRAA